MFTFKFISKIGQEIAIRQFLLKRIIGIVNVDHGISVEVENCVSLTSHVLVVQFSLGLTYAWSEWGCECSHTHRIAAEKEMASLIANKTWTVVSRPKGKPVVDSTWVFVDKYTLGGIFE